MGEEAAEICVQRFLNWYNEQHQGNYIHQRADTYFPDLKNKLNWDFVAYERDNLREWIGIEVKELATVRETSIRFKFWRDLCLELTQDLVDGGVQGEFGILPPVFDLKSEERPKFREAFIEVLCQEAPNMKINEIINIGPDIADKFANWPKEKSNNLDEYHKWGEYRPSELQITKSADSGCEVISLTSPIIVYDGSEAHKEAFDEVFKPTDVKANKQLKLAKGKGAMEVILLLACYPFVHEDLIKNQVHNLDRHLISDIDYIYLVDIGSGDRVIKIYPLDKG